MKVNLVLQTHCFHHCYSSFLLPWLWCDPVDGVSYQVWHLQQSYSNNLKSCS